MSRRPGVIITGGAKRVGATMSRYFAAKGYDVAIHYNASDAEAKKLQSEIAGLGVACQVFSLDLHDSKAIPGFMQAIYDAMPNCTALINNASVFERATFLETDEALFDRQMDINFKAPFFLTQSFAKMFGKGCVINILDTDISQTQGSHFAYLLSKKTLAEFTVMAARELGPHIRVNGVCPGIMLPSDDLDHAYMHKLTTVLPLQKLGGVEQVAHTSWWLIDNAAMTGQMIFVDGGQHIL